MSKIFAEIISFVLNPLVVLIPIPFFLVFETGGTLQQAFTWTIFSLFFVLLFFIFILLGIKRGFFSDLDVSKRKQRPLLFFSAIILTLIYVSVLYFLKAPVILYIGAISIVVGLLVVDLVNRVIKASVHLATLSALLTFLVIIEGWLFVLAFVLIPILAWSRIKTKNHTLQETIVGTSLGILLTITIYVIFKL